MIEMGNVTLSGGWFKMGADDGPHLEDGEGPVRNIWLNPFKICLLYTSRAHETS